MFDMVFFYVALAIGLPTICMQIYCYYCKGKPRRHGTPRAVISCAVISCAVWAMVVVSALGVIALGAGAVAMEDGRVRIIHVMGIFCWVILLFCLVGWYRYEHGYPWHWYWDPRHLQVCRTQLRAPTCSGGI